MPYYPSNLSNFVFSVLNLSFLLLFLHTNGPIVACKDLNLPESHVAYHLNRISRGASGSKKCWGYEDDCDRDNFAFSQPECKEGHSTYIKDIDTQKKTFFNQADFGEFEMLQVKM